MFAFFPLSDLVHYLTRHALRYLNVAAFFCPRRFRHASAGKRRWQPGAITAYRHPLGWWEVVAIRRMVYVEGQPPACR